MNARKKGDDYFVLLSVFPFFFSVFSAQALRELYVCRATSNLRQHRYRRIVSGSIINEKLEEHRRVNSANYFIDWKSLRRAASSRLFRKKRYKK